MDVAFHLSVTKSTSGQATFSKLTHKDDDGLAVMVPVEQSSGEQICIFFLPICLKTSCLIIT